MPQIKYEGLPRAEIRRKLKEELDTLKAQGCNECRKEGRNPYWPSVSMQFDHLPGYEKINRIGHFIKVADEEGFRLELEKCELVCGNHHAVRTSSRPPSKRTVKQLSDKAKAVQREVQNRPDTIALKRAGTLAAIEKARTEGRSWGRPKKASN